MRSCGGWLCGVAARVSGKVALGGKTAALWNHGGARNGWVYKGGIKGLYVREA